MTDSFDLRILSLGAGVQSSALYLMALDGLIGRPKPDAAIFADTQQEPPWVYENLWRLAEEGGSEIPIIIATAGDLGEAQRRKVSGNGGRFASVPFWVLGSEGRAAPGRRQCTREFKIDVVKGEIRRLLGLGYRQWAAGKVRVEEWIGISLDEATRAKPSRYRWIESRWPFLFDRPMRRHEIAAWLQRRGWPEIRKSACVFCPYRNDVEYARWREEEPELFDVACAWDEAIRDASATGIRQPQFISRLLVPLRELPEARILKGNGGQLDLFENECEGMCGV